MYTALPAKRCIFIPTRKLTLNSLGRGPMVRRRANNVIRVTSAKPACTTKDAHQSGNCMEAGNRHKKKGGVGTYRKTSGDTKYTRSAEKPIINIRTMSNINALFCIPTLYFDYSNTRQHALQQGPLLSVAIYFSIVLDYCWAYTHHKHACTQIKGDAFCSALSLPSLLYISYACKGTPITHSRADSHGLA